MAWTRLTVAATFVAAAVLRAAGADADDDSYLTYLRNHGQAVQPKTESTWVALGNVVCSELRQFTPRDQIAKNYTGGPDAQIAIDAAQHELCPDTLSRGNKIA